MSIFDRNSESSERPSTARRIAAGTLVGGIACMAGGLLYMGQHNASSPEENIRTFYIGNQVVAEITDDEKLAAALAALGLLAAGGSVGVLIGDKDLQRERNQAGDNRQLTLQ